MIEVGVFACFLTASNSIWGLKTYYWDSQDLRLLSELPYKLRKKWCHFSYFHIKITDNYQHELGKMQAKGYSIELVYIDDQLITKKLSYVDDNFVDTKLLSLLFIIKINVKK